MEGGKETEERQEERERFPAIQVWCVLLICGRERESEENESEKEIDSQVWGILLRSGRGHERWRKGERERERMKRGRERFPGVGHAADRAGVSTGGKGPALGMG